MDDLKKVPWKELLDIPKTDLANENNLDSFAEKLKEYSKEQDEKTTEFICSCFARHGIDITLENVYTEYSGRIVLEKQPLNDSSDTWGEITVVYLDEEPLFRYKTEYSSSFDEIGGNYTLKVTLSELPLLTKEGNIAVFPRFER